MPRVRMTDDDRELYGGPEWLTFDLAQLVDERAGLIERIEVDWGMTPKEFLAAGSRDSIRAMRAVIWCALLKEGIEHPVRGFRPATQHYSGVRWERTEAEEAAAAADADPPEPANRAERRAAARPTRRKAAASGS